MPARIRTHVAVLTGYLCVAVLFSWPLPAHLDRALLGSVAGDTGVYVWNLWVFQHEIVAHGNLPFQTTEVMPLTPPTPLGLHNYTTAANVVAFFLLPLIGVVQTFNVLTIVTPALAAYAMFLLARRATGDTGASWVAGIAFGFSPFLNARASAHFSLIQAMPLPIFTLLFDRLLKRPTLRLAAATGATVGWAFLSDPYYAVYCALIAAFMTAVAAIRVRVAPRRRRSVIAIDVLLVCLAALIAAILVGGGGRFDVLGVRISITHLYNPVLAFTVLALLRIAMWLRPRITWVPVLPPVRIMLMSALICGALLIPVLAPMGGGITERSNWISPQVFWRSSAPGLDLLSFFLPNPLHPWFGSPFVEGLRQSPGGFVENVASIPWTVFALIATAVAVVGGRLPRRWIAWTLFFGLLALGPFITIAGTLTYVPTPWALLRYVPVIGAARMPTRFAVLVMLGIAMLAAYSLRDLKARWNRPWLVTALVSILLLAESVPAPRVLHDGRVPAVYRLIAADRRDVRVLNLPFGLRDGLSSHGNTTAAWQFFQTVHEKPILGGYLSRLPEPAVTLYRRRRVTRVLMDLSASRAVSEDRVAEAIKRAHEIRDELNVGYVVVDTQQSSPQLVDFAQQAFDLQWVATDGDYVLYRTAPSGEARTP